MSRGDARRRRRRGVLDSLPTFLLTSSTFFVNHVLPSRLPVHTRDALKHQSIPAPVHDNATLRSTMTGRLDNAKRVRSSLGDALIRRTLGSPRTDKISTSPRRNTRARDEHLREPPSRWSPRIHMQERPRALRFEGRVAGPSSAAKARIHAPPFDLAVHRGRNDFAADEARLSATSLLDRLKNARRSAAAAAADPSSLHQELSKKLAREDQQYQPRSNRQIEGAVTMPQSQASTNASRAPPRLNGSSPNRLEAPSLSSSFSLPSSDRTGLDDASQNFDDALRSLEALSFGLDGQTKRVQRASRRGDPAHATGGEDMYAEHESARRSELAKRFSDESEQRMKKELEVREQASKAAYQRITKLVRGISTIAVQLQDTFRGAVRQRDGFSSDIAELSEAMATANSKILEQVLDIAVDAREILGRMQEQQQKYDRARTDFLQSFRTRAKEQFRKYEADRDELFKLAAAVNDTKTSEKQVRSTVKALVQSL
ncbi:hypothetical protein V8E36_004101 [Tilletia maclaganii]